MAEAVAQAAEVPWLLKSCLARVFVTRVCVQPGSSACLSTPKTGALAQWQSSNVSVDENTWPRTERLCWRQSEGAAQKLLSDSG